MRHVCVRWKKTRLVRGYFLFELFFSVYLFKIQRQAAADSPPAMRARSSLHRTARSSRSSAAFLPMAGGEELLHPSPPLISGHMPVVSRLTVERALQAAPLVPRRDLASFHLLNSFHLLKCVGRPHVA